MSTVYDIPSPHDVVIAPTKQSMVHVRPTNPSHGMPIPIYAVQHPASLIDQIIAQPSLVDATRLLQSILQGNRQPQLALLTQAWWSS